MTTAHLSSTKNTSPLAAFADQQIDWNQMCIRDRDIPVLATAFLERFALANRKEIKGFTPQAMDALLKYSWPGNVRELENAVERAAILCLGEYI